LAILRGEADSITIYEANYPVAENVRYLMQEQNIQAYWIAYKLGLSKSELGQMLSGSAYIKSCDIPKLAELFCVSLEELFRPVEGRG